MIRNVKDARKRETIPARYLRQGEHFIAPSRGLSVVVDPPLCHEGVALELVGSRNTFHIGADDEIEPVKVEVTIYDSPEAFQRANPPPAPSRGEAAE